MHTFHHRFLRPSWLRCLAVLCAFDLTNGRLTVVSHLSEPIYMMVSEILFMLACEGAEGGRITWMEEVIARALSFDWEQYDVPGTCKW